MRAVPGLLRANSSVLKHCLFLPAVGCSPGEAHTAPRSIASSLRCNTLKQLPPLQVLSRSPAGPLPNPSIYCVNAQPSSAPW